MPLPPGLPSLSGPTRTVVVIDILLRTRAAMRTTIAAAADWQFFVLLWRPTFCGAPVRPNMLNMPKSTSVDRYTLLARRSAANPRHAAAAVE